MSNKVSESVLSNVSTLAQKGLSPAEIVQELQLSNTHVYRAWKILGLPKARDRARTERLVKEGFESGLDYGEIAQKVGITKSHAYLVLKNLGVPIEDRRYPYKPPRYAFPHPVSPALATEFCGLFWGEGCATLEKIRRYRIFRPALHIAMRKDDGEMLESIYEALGGYFQPHSLDERENHSPQSRWSAFGYSRCRAIIEEVFLPHSTLPARKQKDIALLHEAILARYAMPLLLSESNRDCLHQYYLRLREVKKYQL